MLQIPFIYNLRSMKVRWASTLVAVLGIAGVVAVFLAMLSMARGFRETVKSSGLDSNALVLRGGATTESQSVLTLEQTKIIGDAAGLARDANGNPLISPEVVVNAVLPMRSSGNEVTVMVRGVSVKALEVRDQIKVMQGHFFNPGLAELIIGKNAAKLYQNLDMGGSLSLGGQTWKVVGIFDAGGSVFDSEIWCDVNLLNQTYKKPVNTFQSATVKLSSLEAFSVLKDTLTSDPRLTISVEREKSYYERQSRVLTTLIQILGIIVSLIMAVGAVFAALNTMYAAVSARSPEIATMRALGFSGINIVISFLLESLSIAFLGSIVGCLIILPLNGFTASTTNLTTYSHLAFAFRVTPDLMGQGLIFALLMGCLGGFFPALRAARQSIAGTLRGM